MPEDSKDQEKRIERRATPRRKQDVDTQEIIARVAQEMPINRRLLETGKMASAALAIGALAGALIGGTCAALGGHYVGPHDELVATAAKIDANALRIRHQNDRTDSLLVIVTGMRSTIQTMAFIQCIQLRRSDSDLRPQGCDGMQKAQFSP